VREREKKIETEKKMKSEGREKGRKGKYLLDASSRTRNMFDAWKSP
jgi:hypothetical protein